MDSSINQMKLRRRVHFYSWTGALIFAGILFSMNFMVSFFPIRLDTSQGKIYSLSKGTKKLLRSLDDTLLVRVIFSPKLPSPYSLNEQYVRDFLSECKRASSGKLKIEYFDPNKSEQNKQRAIRDGVYPVELNVTSADKIEVQACFMGLSFHYGDQKESIPFLRDTRGLEYQFAQKVRRFISLEKPTIGFVKNAGAITMGTSSLQNFKPQMEELYSVKDVDLSSGIPSDIKALWVIGPTSTIGPLELGRLREWLENGGALGLLIDRKKITIETFRSEELTTGFEDFLRGYGIELSDGLVADLQADRIQIQAIRGSVQMINFVEFPYFPLITDINRVHPATRDISNFSMPFVSPLSVEKEIPSLTYTVLARTSKYSWLDPIGNDLSPFSNKGQSPDAKRGPFDVMLLVEGNFNLEEKDNPHHGRLIISGDSRFIQQDFAGRPENILLFLNLLDWSAQDELLLSIRTKSSPHRPLRRMPEPIRYAVKYILVFTMPIVAIIIGLIIWRRERRRRLLLSLLYKES